MVDIISNLPDPILHLILSGLPTTEEAVRTSILSTRWRYLWTSVPSVNIDYYRGGLTAPQKFTNNNFKTFVDQVLANQSIDLESFRLSCGNNYTMSTVEQWIEAAVRRKVKLLDLKFCPYQNDDDDPFKKLLPDGTESLTEQLEKLLAIVNYKPDEHNYIELPFCLSTCTSLEVLRLSLFGQGLRFPKYKGFLGLRALEVDTCWILNQNSVKDFLESCPLLEDLSLVNCTTYFFQFLCISCPNLKKLKIDNGNIYDSEHAKVGYGDMCQFLWIYCPKLVYLEIVGHVVEIQIIFESIDSLKKAVIHFQDFGRKVCDLLSEISHVESLSLHLHFTKKNIKLPKSLPNLKTLELNMTSNVFNMHVVIRILKTSPNIESLHLIIKEDSSHPTKVPHFPVVHIFERLKMVKMTGGMTVAVHEMEFIKFLLKSSPVLETITINPSMNMMMTNEKLKFLTNDVVKFPWASPKARIIFVQE